MKKRLETYTFDRIGIHFLPKEIIAKILTYFFQSNMIPLYEDDGTIKNRYILWYGTGTYIQLNGTMFQSVLQPNDFTYDRNIKTSMLLYRALWIFMNEYSISKYLLSYHKDLQIHPSNIRLSTEGYVHKVKESHYIVTKIN